MLRIHGTDCQTVNIHLDVVGYAESASVRGEDLELPTVAGRVLGPGPRIKDVYRFELEGYVRGTGADRDEKAESWRENTDVLMALMDFELDPDTIEIGPEPPANFPNSAPYLGLTDDMFINARCVSMVRGPLLDHMSFQSWSFQMESIDSPPGWQVSGSS